MKSFEQLKLDIIGNRFVDELTVRRTLDDKAFKDLVKDLEVLGRLWRSQDQVDKNLVQELFGLNASVRAAIDSPWWSEDQRDQIVTFHTDLDELITACFD
jgi:hypothetical protein